MFDKLHEECGVFGIFGHPEAAKLAYLGLYALQHRGQESAGIASGDGERVHFHRAMGQVAEIFTNARLERLRGSLAIGHTRYSTTGSSALSNAQPLIVDCNKGTLAIGHNGNLVNAVEIRARLENQGSIFQTTSDTEVILHLLARAREPHLPGALGEALNQVEGAYSLVLLTPDSLYAIRDPRGFRPLAMGLLPSPLPGQPQAVVFASETCAFDLIGAAHVRDVAPGEWVRVTKDGIETRRFAPALPPRHCIFEHVYFSRPDSVVFGRSVQESREMMGRLLARQAPVPADLVVPVPDSGVSAAIGFSAESGLPFRFGLIRNHYVGRTFIEPSQQIRDFGVKLKLNPVRSLLEGQRVILVDDSIVRGTTSRKIVRMIREAGAREVHLRISCPPTISPCYYGVDTPSKGELIAANQSVEQIREFVGADSLAYLSIENLHAAAGDSAVSRFCTACYTGDYPTEVPEPALIAIRQA
ncbi:MAG TPA: amidophosphoribosyltransferase [Terriglobales bacterium]|nr:amidophosphoribosyltransferase [Terriglobales bacterium]